MLSFSLKNLRRSLKKLWAQDGRPERHSPNCIPCLFYTRKNDGCWKGWAISLGFTDCAVRAAVLGSLCFVSVRAQAMHASFATCATSRSWQVAVSNTCCSVIPRQMVEVSFLCVDQVTSLSCGPPGRQAQKEQDPVGKSKEAWFLRRNPLH